MIAISDTARTDIRMIGSLMLMTAFALGVLLLHSREHIAFAQGATTSKALQVPIVPQAESLTYPRLLRDPFAQPASLLQGADVYAGSSLIGMHVVGGTQFSRGLSGMVGLPANAGAAHTPLRASQASALLVAVASGRDARALVDTSGTLHIVAVGDHLGDSIVTKIAAAGMWLSDGEFLTSSQFGSSP